MLDIHWIVSSGRTVLKFLTLELVHLGNNVWKLKEYLTVIYINKSVQLFLMRIKGIMIYTDIIVKVGQFLVIPKRVSLMFFENVCVNLVCSRIGCDVRLVLSSATAFVTRAGERLLLFNWIPQLHTPMSSLRLHVELFCAGWKVFGCFVCCKKKVAHPFLEPSCLV